jgi:hypothetical protein
MTLRPWCCVALVGLTAGVFLGLASNSWSQVNVSLNKPVINGSGSWNGDVVGVGAPFDGGTFPASLTVDGNTTEPDNGAVSYWLGRQGTAPEFFTLDLGQAFHIDEVRLFNTHNRQFNDRRSDEFVLYAGNTKDAMNQITDEIPILSANLSNVDGQNTNPIIPDIFTPANGLLSGVLARYVRFEAINVPVGESSVGLNEIQIIDFDPPPPPPSPIIDGNGAYFAEPFNSGTYPASKVVDGAPGDSTGSFWLGPEGVAPSYFTIDLEHPDINVNHVAEIRLRNTHNANFNDRGTRDFRVWAADAVDGSNQLINPTVILEGRLPNVAGLNPPPDTVFTAANGLTETDARYLKFEALSAYYGANNVGLNEFEVFETAQHPPTPRLREGNIAAGKPVINGSGSWGSGVMCDPATPFNAGGFPADRVTDESIADNHVATGRASYWLGREACLNEYFIIDLQGVYDLDEIVLVNSHNEQFNDRGTGEFVIYGSQTVDGANELVGEVVVLSAELASVAGTAVIPEEGFFIDPSVPPVRYLKFQALTILSSAANSGAGLNELQAYGTIIPEPSSWALAAIGAVVGGLVVRRRVRLRR